MKKLGSVAVAAALATGLLVAASGSAYAGQAGAPVVAPSVPTFTGTVFQDDLTGCGASHRMHVYHTDQSSALP